MWLSNCWVSFGKYECSDEKNYDRMSEQFLCADCLLDSWSRALEDFVLRALIPLSSYKTTTQNSQPQEPTNNHANLNADQILCGLGWIYFGDEIRCGGEGKEGR